MSAASINRLQDNAAATAEDDSDLESDAGDIEGSYAPISFNSDSESEPDHASQPESDNPIPILSNGRIPNPNPIPDFSSQIVSNGVSLSSLHLNGRVEEEEEAEEVERERDASISRAFREDESRRNAPLTQENASRVVEAMRGVRFPGLAPEWADQVPADRWLDRLRRLRGEDTAATSQS